MEMNISRSRAGSLSLEVARAREPKSGSPVFKSLARRQRLLAAQVRVRDRDSVARFATMRVIYASRRNAHTVQSRCCAPSVLWPAENSRASWHARARVSIRSRAFRPRFTRDANFPATRRYVRLCACTESPKRRHRALNTRPKPRRVCSAVAHSRDVSEPRLCANHSAGRYVCGLKQAIHDSTTLSGKR